MEKVLITGGAGFIGSNLTKFLLNKGYEVKILDNLSTGHLENLTGLDVEVIKGDLRDVEIVNKCIKGAKIVFHLAANIGNIKSINNPKLDSEINVLGTINILEASKNVGVEKLIYSSSAAIYGELLYNPIDENHPINPTSPYGVSKFAGEKLAICYGTLFDFTCIGLRYFNVFGENQRYDEYGNVIPIFAEKMKRNQPLTIYGDGNQTRDFVHVADVALANYLAALKGNKSDFYNVGTGESISINYLVSKMIEFEGTKVQVNYEKPRKGEVLHCKADIGKISADLGFSPQMNFEISIVNYLHWFKNNK